jgi:transcriptional regulator with XRE-family HTH domain
MVIGSEPTVQNEAEIFGAVLKSARLKAGLTVEALAERVGVTDRYIYRLENNGKTPGYAVLCRLIQELAISPDMLFYSEKSTQDSEVENLLRKLATCDERAIKVAKATIQSLIDTAPKET